MLKYSSRWVAAFLAVAILGACTRPEESARTNDSLTVGVLGDFDSLDPLLLQGSETAAIVPLVFSYLVTVDAAGRLTPDLALDVPSTGNGGVSRDGTTVVYHLRKGVLWQDGAPLTSADVAYTYRQIMNPRNNVPARTSTTRSFAWKRPTPGRCAFACARRTRPCCRRFLAPTATIRCFPSIS